MIITKRARPQGFFFFKGPSFPGIEIARMQSSALVKPTAITFRAWPLSLNNPMECFLFPLDLFQREAVESVWKMDPKLGR